MPHNIHAAPARRGARCFGVLAVIFTIILSVFSASTAPLEATEPLHLNMAAPYDARHPLVSGIFLPWIKAVHEQSQGSIQIDFFDANTLLIEGDALAPVVTGSLALGAILPSSLSPTPPVSDVFNAYLDAPNARIASLLVWESVQFHQALKAEMQLVHLLWAWSSSPAYLHTTDKAVHSIQDIQNMKLLVWSNLMEEFVRTIGGIPVRCMPAESSQMLRRGLAQGIICPIPPLLSFGAQPYIRFTTDFPLEYYSFFMGMNKEIWNALSPDHKRIFTETTGRNMVKRSGTALDTAESEIRQQLTDKGHIFVPVDEKFRHDYQNNISPIRLQRLEKAKALHIHGMTEFGPLLREIRSDIKRTDAGHKF